MAATIQQQRYRTALCPYLMVGNGRVLVHLDAYCVPQTLNWPQPGTPDRLGWRDPLDEWPYWEEMSDEDVRARMPYFEYADGSRDYLHDATDVAVDYAEDTNVLQGRYALPSGAVVEIETFVPPERDIWVRRWRVRGTGKMVLQSEFFEKAVRGHALAHMGNVSFRGAFDAEPQGAYVLMCTSEMPQAQTRVEMPVVGEAEWTLHMCMAKDLASAVALGDHALADGFDTLRSEAIEDDRRWISQAREPKASHPFVTKNHRRWLLANRLVTGRDGAMVCGPRPFWQFVWPRDCSLQVGAYAKAGFVEEARNVARWLLDRAPGTGAREARYRSNGEPMLLDNRPRQGDNPGFVCWAAATVCRAEWDEEWAAQVAPNLYILADGLVESRDEETLLPLPAADYREGEIAESLGIAVTAIGGLDGAGEIARRLGDSERGERYQARADEIRRGAETHLWNREGEYFMQSVKPLRDRQDITIGWGVGPFGAWPGDDPRSVSSVKRVVAERWNAEAGGALACAGTPYESFWMFHTGILLLGVAATGNRDLEKEILDSLEKNASPQGLVPEQIGRSSGLLWGCAPLPVAHSNLLLYAYA